MNYYYLISSLPTVTLGEKPFYTVHEYMNMCKGLISESDYNELESIKSDPRSMSGNSEFIKMWKGFETEIRNLSSKVRAAKLGKDASNYLKVDAISSSDIDKGISDAFAATSPLDREMILDKVRWSILESLEVGGPFTFKRLCVYKLKLMICEKWLTRKVEQGQANLEAILNSMYEAK